MKINQFKDGFAFLSNFHPVSIEYEGITYPSVEHAFQAAKSLDVEQRRRIASISGGRGAKHAGRRLKLRPNWNEIKLSVMETLVRKKFEHPELRQLLIDTHDMELIEGNTWGDQWWGVNLKTGKGENYLGKTLMKIRAEITNKD